MANGDRAARDVPDLHSPELRRPVVMKANEKRVRRNFWRKMKRVLHAIPFAEEAIAAYYCALDPATPTRVKAILLAALAYFIIPFDVLPDLLLGLGFTDDATVLMAAVSLIRSHMTPAHRQKAREALERLEEDEAPPEPPEPRA